MSHGPRGERPGDGLAHEPEGRAVGGKAGRVCSAAVERRCDAGHKCGVVGKPSVHVTYALDSKPAACQGRLQLCQPGIRCLLQSGGLLPDVDELGGPAGHDATDAREPEVDIAGHVTGDGRPACRVVAEEDDGGPRGQRSKPGACRRELITPDRNNDYVVSSAGVRHHGGFGLSPLPAEDVAGGKASCGHLAGPRFVAQHGDLMSRSCEMCPRTRFQSRRTRHTSDALVYGRTGSPRYPCAGRLDRTPDDLRADLGPVTRGRTTSVAAFCTTPRSHLRQQRPDRALGRHCQRPSGQLRLGYGYRGLGRISTYPSVPCTRIRCQSWISRVACSTPTTAGRPYSRAITAPWVIRPPTSVTRPVIATNRGDQLGSV